MERNILIVAAVLVVGIAAYFLFLSRGDTATTTVNTTPTPIGTTATPAQETPTDAMEATPGVLNVELDEQNDSGQNGTATVMENNGRVIVSIDITPNEEGTPQPAHIHMGSCPEPGDIVFPLTNVVDGTSETTIDTTMEDLEELMPLAINIHKSATESSVYTACGDLK